MKQQLWLKFEKVKESTQNLFLKVKKKKSRKKKGKKDIQCTRPVHSYKG